jgi:hypothetical protein
LSWPNLDAGGSCGPPACGSCPWARTQAPGRLLDLGADGTDGQLAERLVRRGLQAEGHTDAARQPKAALALWRGRSLLDTSGLPWLDAQAERLDLLWLQASRALVGARLALGQHEQVLPALEALTRDRPFDELLHGQLMLALHRGGRQRAALAAYHPRGVRWRRIWVSIRAGNCVICKRRSCARIP